MVIKGKLKNFYELCRVSPRIPSVTLHALAKAVDSDGMLELRSTAVDNVYVHAASCMTVPEDAFEYFTEDLSHVVVPESPQSVLDTDPIRNTPETFRVPYGADSMDYGYINNDVHDASNVDLGVIQRASVNLDDALNNLYVHSEPLEGTLSSDPSLTMDDVLKVSPECSESALSTAEIEPLVMSKSLFTKATQLRHRTHYIKLTLKDPNLSFRYFYESEDNKHQEGFWWLKDHKNKASIQVDTGFIRKHYEDIVEMHEIIGRHLFKKGYRKIVKNLRTNELVELKDI